MQKQFFARAALLCAPLLILSCGKSNGSNNNTVSTTIVTVSGNIVPHPLDGTNLDYTSLELLVANPQALIVNPDASPLGQASLNATACNMNGCSYSVPNVNITGVSLGLLLGVVDTRPTPIWFPTYTGIAANATLTTSQTKKTPITGTIASALTVSALDQLATVASLDANTLAARGFLLGTIVGKQSEADASGIPPAITGATVTVQTGSEVSIFYLTSNYAAASTSGMTSSNGSFLAVPNQQSAGSTALTAYFTVTPPAGDTIHKWTGTTLAGMAAQKALILAIPADS